jgi:poly(A) polymerase/tRNA nucleotidyltransferase (CCA-adding enzyme)
MAFDTRRKRILDPHGGRKDIRRRLIRAVGDPEERFREDPIRLLRAVRLSVALGFTIEQNTLDTLSSMAGMAASVARERIRDELMKILLCPRPSLGFDLMRKTGLLEEFLPELMEGYRKRQNRYHRYTIYRHIMETVDGVEPDPVLRLTALLHDIAKPRVRRKKKGVWRFTGHEEASAKLAGEIMARLKFSKAMIKKIVNLIEHHMIWYRPEWRDGAVRRLIRRVGDDNIGRLIAFRRADLIAHGITDHKIGRLSDLEKRVGDLHKDPSVRGTVDLAIDGRRIMALQGLPPGPEVGKRLKRLMERVTDHPELNTEEGLIALLKKLK